MVLNPFLEFATNSPEEDWKRPRFQSEHGRHYDPNRPTSSGENPFPRSTGMMPISFSKGKAPRKAATKIQEKNQQPPPQQREVKGSGNQKHSDKGASLPIPQKEPSRQADKAQRDTSQADHAETCEPQFTEFTGPQKDCEHRHHSNSPQIHDEGDETTIEDNTAVTGTQGKSARPEHESGLLTLAPRSPLWGELLWTNAGDQGAEEITLSSGTAGTSQSNVEEDKREQTGQPHEKEDSP